MDDRRRHGYRSDAARGWNAYRRSPYFAATVLTVLLSLAAGLFAGSYIFAMANPAPRSVPIGLIGDRDTVQGRAFVAGFEQALGASLVVHHFDSYGEALDSMEEQEIFAVLDVRPSSVELDVSGASGFSVAQVLTEAAPAVARRAGVPVTVRDVRPLQRGDPRALALFYITLAAVIVGFVGAIQLGVNAPGLKPGERIAWTVAYSVLGALSIDFVASRLLRALVLPFPESWLILALTMFVSGMVFSMFDTLLGRWAIVPTWGLMVVIGNPSSGGAVSWPLLPSVLGAIGRWLPPGASVNAQHAAVYFRDHQHAQPYLVLIAWALLSCAVFLTRHGRRPAARPLRRIRFPGRNG
jgi:hypothetical protein